MIVTLSFFIPDLFIGGAWRSRGWFFEQDAYMGLRELLFFRVFKNDSNHSCNTKNVSCEVLVISQISTTEE